MSFKVQVGPPQITQKSGSILAAGAKGAQRELQRTTRETGEGCLRNRG